MSPSEIFERGGVVAGWLSLLGIAVMEYLERKEKRN